MNGYVNPVTVEERLLHIAEAKRVYEGVTMPWLCDNISNELKKQLGGMNNPEFVFDPEGKIVRMRDWCSPATLRKDLETLTGKTPGPTSVKDLNLKVNNKSKEIAATGVVPALKIPGQMSPIKSTASDDSESPFYAKVRPEADSELLRNGSGKLYLGIRLDPLLGVCWNNLAEPVKYELTGTDGMTIEPRIGTGPKVEVESDSDPREFLIDIKDWKAGEPLKLSLSYFACHKEKGWCKAVTQSYELQLERDRDAGSVRSRNGGGRGGRGGGAGRGGRGGAGRRGRGGRRGPGGRGQGGGGRGPRGGGQRPVRPGN